MLNRWPYRVLTIESYGNCRLREQSGPQVLPPMDSVRRVTVCETEIDCSVMAENKIRDILVERGKSLFSAPAVPVEFTGNATADALVNDRVRS